MEEEGKGRGEREDQYRSSEITYNGSRQSHVQDMGLVTYSFVSFFSKYRNK